MTYHNLRKRNGCQCKIKWTYKIIKQIFENDKNILLTKKSNYNTSTDIIEYICKCGQKSSTCFSSYLRNNRICPYCTNKGKGIIDGEYGIYIESPIKYKTKWYIKNNKFKDIRDSIKNSEHKKMFNRLIDVESSFINMNKQKRRLKNESKSG